MTSPGASEHSWGLASLHGLPPQGLSSRVQGLLTCGPWLPGAVEPCWLKAEAQPDTVSLPPSHRPQQSRGPAQRGLSKVSVWDPLRGQADGERPCVPWGRKRGGQIFSGQAGCGEGVDGAGVGQGRGQLGGCSQNLGVSFTWRMGLGGKREAHLSHRKEHVQRSCGTLQGGNQGSRAQGEGERLREMAGGPHMGLEVFGICPGIVGSE